MAKQNLSKCQIKPPQKPDLSPEDQKIWVGATLKSLGDQVKELSVHIQDLGTLLYERAARHGVTIPRSYKQPLHC